MQQSLGLQFALSMCSDGCNGRERGNWRCPNVERTFKSDGNSKAIKTRLLLSASELFSCTPSAFPVMGQFLKDPEGVFLEDLELYTFIPRECVLIYRRGCSADGKAYEFQIGIISSKCTQFRKVPIEQPQLKSLSPLMFLANPSFMMDNALKVAYVRKPV
uniref:Uncharacterized protein n=1 Tax=Globodera rostochiensis TaxID=31243 RepID=A0A914H9F8_GLORO